MSLPRYSEYKDSGVEWLGEVPAHWTVAPLKRGFDVRLGKMLQPAQASDEDVLAPYLRAANIQWGRVDLDDVRSMWFSPRERELLALQAGDLLVSEGGDVGRSSLWRAQMRGCYFQNSVNRVRARGPDHTDYLYYWMATIKAKGYVDVLCNKSTIAHFTAEKVAAVPTIFPEPQEQRQIAAFLDRETAKIDALIAEQEKLLALLAEKRQAAISHALTLGLNPNARLKDSGFPWLGKVPAHWKLVPCRFLVSERDKRNEGAANQDYLSLMANVGVIPYAEKGDVGNKKPEDLSKCKMVEAGDLVINSMNYGIGSYGLSPLTGVCSPVYIVLQVKQAAALREFVYRIFQNRGFQRFAQSFGNGILAHRAAIGWGVLKGLQVALPSLSEQREIVEFVESVEGSERKMRIEGERTIALLQERRSALILAAVSGQIDVRGAGERRGRD